MTTIEETKDLLQKFEEQNLTFAPDSIMHGYKVSGTDHKTISKKLKIGIEQKNSFIIWLFEESGHVDHIAMNDAYTEFCCSQLNE
jgi:hypothetical protein